MTNYFENPSIPELLEQLNHPQPWQIATLVQDNLVWDSLKDKAFLDNVGRRLARSGNDLAAAELSPAAFSLDALGYPGLLNELRTNPAATLPEGLLKLLEAGEAKPGWGSEAVNALRTAGLSAIVLHQQMTKNAGAPAAAWENLIEELPNRATTLACLYGMLPRPAALLTALLKAASKQPTALKLICHILLSSPLNPDALQSIFQRVLTQVGLSATALPAAPSATALDMVDVLSELRPELGARLAGWLEAELPQANLVEAIHPAAAIPALLARAKLHQLNGNPEQAAADLSAAANQANLLVAELQTVHANELSHHPQNTQQALKQLEMILAVEEPRPHPWIVRQRTNHLNYLAGHLLNSGHTTQALEAARLLQERSPGNPTVHYILGASLLAQAQTLAPEQADGRVADAIQNLELASAMDPHSIGNLRRLAEAYAAAGQFEDGMAVHERITAESELRQDPGLLQDLLSLSQCAVRAGSPNRAIEAANQALALLENSPSGSEAAGQAYALQGRAHQLMGDFNTAIQHLQKAVQLNPQEPSAWLSLALCTEASGNEEMRVEVLSTAVQALPRTPTLHLALGQALFEQALLTEAQESLFTAHELCTESRDTGLKHDTALAYGRVLLALNHQVPAGKLLAEAFALRPASPTTARLYGHWLLENDQPGRAAEVLETAADAPTADVDLVLDYARALLKSDGDAQRAIRALERILPALGTETEDEALGLLGEAHNRLGEHQVAFDIFRAVLLRSPLLDKQKNGALSLGLGCSALALSEEQPELKEVAHAALQDAATLCPEHAPTRRFLAEAAWANGLDNEAWAAAKATLDLDNTLEGALWYAGQVLERTSSAQAAEPQHLDFARRGIRALRACKQQGGLPNPALLRIAKLFQLANQPANALGALKAIQASATAQADELEETAGLFLMLDEDDCALKALVLAAERAATPYHKAALLARQSDLHTTKGQPAEATAALNAAIEVSPFDMDMHIRLVRLHTTLRQYDLADQAAQRAQESCAQCGGNPGSDVTTAALHGQLAELYLATGRLVQSYAHGSRAIQIIANAAPLDAAEVEATGMAFSATVQAAQGLLLPGKAAAILRSPLYPRSARPEKSNTVLHCLAAQHALETGADLEAVEILTPVLADAASSEQPWVKTLQALILLHSNRDETDIEQASQLLESVFNTCLKPSPSSADIETGSPLALAALSDAALSLSLKPATWERLISAIQRLITDRTARTAASSRPTLASVPEMDPLAGLLLVQMLVRRAEYRQLCLDLQAVQSAPLPDKREGVICFETLQNVEAALLNARQEATALPGENLACDLDENAWGPAMQTLERWKTRAAAIFGEPLPALWIAWDTTRLAAQGMATDAAAYLASLRNHDSREHPTDVLRVANQQTTLMNRWMPTAHQLGQAHLDEPLVQIQAALLAAAIRPENAQAFASRAISAACGPHYPHKALPTLTPLAHAAHALVCCHLNLPELALQSYQAALDFLPEEPRWHLTCANLLSGRSLPASENGVEIALAEAIAHLEEAVRLEPGYALHSLSLGRILAALPPQEIPARTQGKRVPPAGQRSSGDPRRRGLLALERASRLFPTDAAIWLALARAQVAEQPVPARSGALEASARRAAELAHKAGQHGIEAAALCLNGQMALRSDDAETAYRAGRQAVHLLGQPLFEGSELADTGRGQEGRASDPLDDNERSQLGAAAVLIQVEALERLDRFSDALDLLESSLGALPGTDGSEGAETEQPQDAGLLPLRLKHAHLVSLVHGPQAGIERLEHLQSQSGEGCPQVEAALAFDMAAAGRTEEAILQARQSLAHMATAGTSALTSSLGKDLLPMVTPAALHTLLGRLLAGQGQLDQSLHHFSSAIKTEPGQLEAYLELAAVYNRQRQFNKALQTLEQATKVAPLDPRAYHLAGVLYREGRDFPRAAELLRRAADLDPDNAEIRRQLLAVMAAGFFSSANTNVEAAVS